MIIICLLLLLFQRQHSSAFPVITSEPDALSVPIYIRQEPAADCAGRSVWDIVWSCLATTFAVTWVSVHPNVPWFKSDNTLGRRIFLMVLSLLFPELVVAWAFKQWRGAVLIKDTINKAKPESSQEWTTMHGHFLQMGGFRLTCSGADLDVIDDPEYEQKSRILKFYSYRSDLGDDIWQVTLPFWKLKLLLKERKIDLPTTTKEEIEDRSKGDVLSKGVAILQIVWFILQILARNSQGLSVTQIELTTGALAALNVIMYAFWWNKPLDVQCPVTIYTKDVEKMLAGRSVTEHDWVFQRPDELDLKRYARVAFIGFMSQIRTILDLFIWTLPDNLLYLGHAAFSNLNILLQFLRKALLCLIATTFSTLDLLLRTLWKMLHQCHADASALEPANPERLSQEPNIDIDTTAFQKLGNIRVRKHPRETLICFMRRAGASVALLARYLLVRRRTSHSNTELPMPEIDDTKAFQVVSFIKALGSYVEVILQGGDETIYFLVERHHSAEEVMVSKSIGNMGGILCLAASTVFYCEDTEVHWLLILSATGGALFGAVHSLGWNSEFPSRHEKITWRTSSLIIVGECCYVLIGTLPSFASSLVAPRRDSALVRILVSFIGEFIPLLYLPVRICLIILAIVSLRQLSASELQAVEWTTFFPHI